MPGLCGKRAAGHLMHRLVIVIAEPNAANEIAGVANKPGITVSIGGSSLSRSPDAVERGSPGGAFFDYLGHHPNHIDSHLRRYHLHRLLAVTVPPPDQLAGAAAHFEHGMRSLRFAEISEHRVTASVVKHRHLVGADRHRRRVGERRADARLARGLADHGAADFRVALADRN